MNQGPAGNEKQDAGGNSEKILQVNGGRRKFSWTEKKEDCPFHGLALTTLGG